MKYDQIQDLPDEQFRRLTGIKRKTFERMLKILKRMINAKNLREAARISYP